MRDERLEDALKYIDELLELLKNYVSTNDTPEGRAKHELRWFKQEILEGRLTNLPAPYEQSSTIRYVYSEGYLKHIDVPRQKRLGKLFSLLAEGHYLMKPQFYQLAIEEIDKMLGLLGHVRAASMAMPHAQWKQLCDVISKDRKSLTQEQRTTIYEQLVHDLHVLRTELENQSIQVPVTLDGYFGASLANRSSIFGYRTPEDNEWQRIFALIFEGVRPDPNGKIANRRW